MSIATQPDAPETIIYPESDGQPMADNTKQFRIIVTIQGGIDALFRDNPNVFVAGDLLWYPVEGKPAIRRAPDILVAFGRPKGDRGAYLQWQAAGVVPQVVFEVLSPGNTMAEMAEKFTFYDVYGVEEYYLYDPDTGMLQGWQRIGGRLRAITAMDGWRSPRLGVRFVLASGELALFAPDGRRFLSYVELEQLAEHERSARAEAEQLAEHERSARTEAEQLAEQQRLRAERLAQHLRALGIDPDAA